MNTHTFKSFALIAFFFAIISTPSFGQYSAKGYIINSAGEKIDGLIDFDIYKSPIRHVNYTPLANSTNQQVSSDEIKGFGIPNVLKYIKTTVQIDRSNSGKRITSASSKPEYKEEEVFLLVLIEGKGSLYEYKEGGKRWFFYQTEGGKISPLLYKEYMYTKNQKRANSYYKKQLQELFNCKLDMTQLNALNYTPKALSKFFSQYNSCIQSEAINYNKKIARPTLKIHIKGGIGSNKLVLQTGSADPAPFVESNWKTGVEIEFYKPFRTPNVSIAFAPTLRSFESNTPTQNGHKSPYSAIAELKTKTIEMPASLRYYIPIKKNIRAFVQAGIAINAHLMPSISLTESNLLSLEEQTGKSFDISIAPTFGTGINIGRAMLELRYIFAEEALKGLTFWQGQNQNLSLLIGYRIN